MSLENIALRVAVSFALQRQNLMDEQLLRHVNHALREPDAFGASGMSETLNYFGLTFDERPGLSKPLRYKSLRQPVRNAYLWVNGGKGSVRWKKDVDPLDKADIDRAFGRYVEEPDEPQN